MANNFPTIKPSLNLQFANTGILPPDVTFTRASSSGGYYDGKTVAKAEENLILQSQTFNSGWILDNATVSANSTTAPDGTVTADTIVETATTSSHLIRQATIALSVATYVASVFAKSSTRSMMSIGFDGQNAWFNLSTGVVGTVESGLTASIVDAGSGWYRCIVTRAVTIANAKTFGLYVVTTDGSLSYAGDGTSGIFVWGAQLERRDAATAYTPTTTQPITRYQPKLEYAIANEPVFDHNPTTGESLGLSVWEARTNLVLRSKEFDNAYWSKADATVSANQIIAPDGTLTMDKLVENTANVAHFINREVTGLASAGTVTYSIFVKAAERNQFRISRAGGAVASAFNLSSLTVTNAAGSTGFIVPVGNGVFRVGITFAIISTSTAPYFELQTTASVSSQSYTGDGFSGIYIWGAQLEAGTFATPYIPTVASTVTRSADLPVMTGANFTRWYRADEGTFVVDFTNVGASVSALSANDGTNNNRIALVSRPSTASSNDEFAVVVVHAAGQASLNAISYTTQGKNAISYKFNDIAGTMNGAAVRTDTTAAIPVVDRLSFGAASTSVSSIYIKSIQYYPARLTNAQLQAVTA